MRNMVLQTLGGIVVALVIFDWAKHYYYVAKHVWPMQRAFREPTRTMPAPGVVTLNGIVSVIDEHEQPIKVTLHEYGRGLWQSMDWDQTSRSVKVHPFGLLIPHAKVTVLVEPDDDVVLRSSAYTTAAKSVESSEIPTDWANDHYDKKVRRQRIGVLEGGDVALVTGVLQEKHEPQIVTTGYRSNRGEAKIEYVLRPLPNEPMRIDSVTLLDEYKERLGHWGMLLTVGIFVVPFGYIQRLWEKPVPTNSLVPLVIALLYIVLRLAIMAGRIDRRPWFERPIPPQPYSFTD